MIQLLMELIQVETVPTSSKLSPSHVVFGNLVNHVFLLFYKNHVSAIMASHLTDTSIAIYNNITKTHDRFQYSTKSIVAPLIYHPL